jgi:hypothetical protein
MENFLRQMDPVMKASGKLIKNTEKEKKYFLIKAFMKVRIKMTKNKELENKYILIKAFMKVHMLMTKNKEMENFFGQYLVIS